MWSLYEILVNATYVKRFFGKWSGLMYEFHFKKLPPHFRLNKTFSLPMRWRHVAGVVVQLRPFLTSALDECGWSSARHGRISMTEPRYALNRRLGGYWRRSFDVLEKRNISCPSGIRPLDRPALSPVIIPLTGHDQWAFDTDNRC